MKMIRGLSLKKLLNREKNSILFVNEIKIHMCALALVTIGMEIFLLTKGDSFVFQRGIFVLSMMCCFFLLCSLEYIIRIFANTKFAPLLSILPGVLAFIQLKRDDSWNIFAYAALLAIIVRLFFSYVPYRDKIITYGCYVLVAVTIYLWYMHDCFIGNFHTDKFLIICLLCLTLASIQQLIFEKNRGSFPFHYFLLIGLLVLIIPTKLTPIDWSPIETLVGKAATVSKHAYYFLEDVFSGDNYSTGYGSFNVSGGKIKLSQKEQLIITTPEKPYFVFTDEESQEKKKLRRTVYLAGGKGVDKQQIVQFIQFLYHNNVNREYAELFSQISNINIEYVYLNTPDEIAPSGALMITNEGEIISKGVSDENHQKGYQIETKYLNIDYGSPYLIDLYRKADNQVSNDTLSFEDADKYMFSLYNVDLSDIVTEQEYYSFSEDSNPTELYLETGGNTDQIKALASEVTAGADNDYDKCKQIESYLRQYTYNTDVSSGYDSDATMATATGMANIADRFLFETKEGYCVHYTSSMVMLLRLSGIPARAVMGYRYAFPFEVQDDYLVTGECAHVWPEAYISNVGWVPFEPTSAYSTADAYTWHRKLESDTAEKAGDAERRKGYIPSVPSVSVSSGVQETSRIDGMQVIRVIGFIVAGIVVLLLLVILGAIIIKTVKYMLATPEQRLKLDVETIKGRLTKQSGQEITDRGLLSDYVQIAPEDIKSDIQKTVSIYYKMQYGSAESETISEEDGVFVREVSQRLKKYKKQAGSK